MSEILLNGEIVGIASKECVDAIGKCIEKYEQRIAKLEAKNKALREAQRWIPVGESMPPPNRRYRVWLKGDECESLCWLDAEHGWDALGAKYGEEITHWQNESEPPQEQNQ